MPAEIEIPRGWIIAIAGVLIVVCALIGWINTPFGDDGKPLFLSPERRAILRYIESAGRWAGRLQKVEEMLDDLTPPTPVPPTPSPTPVVQSTPAVTSTEAVTPTPVLTATIPGTVAPLITLPAPASQAGDLYERAHNAREAYQELSDLAQEIERTRVPDALIGLHGLVVQALETHLLWAEGILTYAGAPDAVDPYNLAFLRLEAMAALDTLETNIGGQ